MSHGQITCLCARPWTHDRVT
ncbi:hypothetical protein F383_15764 [Gossypium arboreum]|uniref:Uncharacterized protein n=1 Tax=Gossypium arboreum TaxID=29729 RepID=A0A0B0PYI4_GOSAR|nr:hypothetical protein F383_15764 [Gossypium arboreum]